MSLKKENHFQKILLKSFGGIKMKKIISLMILLLMIATVSARTEEKKFETYVNFTKNDTAVAVFTEGGPLGSWICNGTLTGPTSTNSLFPIYRYVSYEDVGGLENITKVMEELVEVSLQLADYGNDSRSYLDKYIEMKGAHALVVKDKDDYKADLKKLENVSIQLTACQSELTNMRMTKNQCNTDLAKCAQDLTDQKASTQTAWVIGIIIGAGGLYLITNVKKWLPAEKDSFQH